MVLWRCWRRAPTPGVPGQWCDAAAVATLATAGVGQTVQLKLGGTLARSLYQPVEVTGIVKLISGGEFTHKGPGFHG